MKKRILSLVLATLMIISVLPAHALADDNPLTTYAAAAKPTKTVSAASTDGSVHVNKSISEDEKTLTLEAFATNTVSTETTYDPLDIVLVLDVSGSMRDCINCDATYDYYSDYGWYWSNNSEYCNDRPQYTYEKKGFAKNLTEKDAPLYKANTDGSYSEVEWCNGQHMLWTHQPGWYENGFISHSRVNDNTILYKQVKAEQIKHQHRIDALKTAVGDFIDSVAAQKDSKGKTIANKISIVKFASDLNEAIGDDKDTDGYNYSQIVKGLTDVNTGSEDLKNAVNELTAAGATSADYGMQLAASVLDKRKTDDPSTKLSKSVVILFTDGEPNHENSFDDKVASNAISAAKALKDGGTSVFTVGVFKGANPDTDVSTADKTNKYMHAVSSNYPSAAYTKSESGWEESWNWNFGTGAENSNYYLAASNASELNAVFQAISQQVSSLTAKVDAASVLSDTLSGAFTFDPTANADYSGITVAKYPVTGMENGAYTWGAAQELTIGEGKDVQVKVDGKKLEVTGFDYGANAVTTKTEGDKTTYSGYKLVVTIPIKPDTTYTGWQQGEHYYDTNSIAEGSRAGLSYGNNGSQKLELTDSPEAPVTGYKVTYSVTGDKPEDFNDVTDPKVYIEGQTAKVKETPNTTSTSNGQKQGRWKFNDWYNGSTKADTTINITDNVTLTGTWTFTEAAKYGVTYTYVAAEGSPTLPDAIKTTEGTYAVSDSETYYVNATVTRKNPTSSTYTDATNHGTWTLTWDKDGATMTAGGVTFTGTWTFTADAPAEAAYTIEYYKMKADGTYGTTPDEVDDAAANIATIGQPKTISAMKTFKGYVFDKDNAANVVTINSIAASGNVFKLYYKATAGLDVHKDVDKKTGIEVGDTLTYTITVCNTGTLNLRDITVTDKFEGSGKLDFTDCEYDVTDSGNVYSFKIHDLDADATVTITATYKVVEGDSGNEIKNTVVAEEGGDGPRDEDEIIVTPGELDLYIVSVPVVKKLVNNRSDFDGETFEFEISYTNAAGNKVVTTLKIPVGKVFKGETATECKIGEFTLSEEDFENLPKDDDWYHGDKQEGDNYELPYIMIHEVAGSTEHMSYASSWVKAYLVLNSGDASALSLREPQYTTIRVVALAQPDAKYTMDSAATFVNEYVKKPTDDKDVTPAKVSPQLNRDDHVAYIMGYPDGKVRPEGEITRAEACTIFFRLLTEESRDYYFTKTNDYTDVSRSDWFNNAISTLSNAGIVTGYADGTFRPDQPITRGEMAKIIANFARLGGATKSFTDLSGHWAKTYVELAAGNGWIEGYPDGTFGPDKKITRAETVTMINRVLDRVPAKESRLLPRSVMLTFPDNEPGEWYYIAIQEATNSHTYQRSAYETAGDEMWIKLIDNVDWTKLEK